MILGKSKTIYILFYFFLIFGALIIGSSPSKVSKRFLQYNNDYSYDNYNYSDPYNNKDFNETSDDTSAVQDPGTYLLAWFTIFFFMGLYIICTMKQYKEIASRTDEVWKFMFFANNGILVAAGINIFNVRNLILDSSPFALSAIGFIVGCVYYIAKYCQTCNIIVASSYFEFTKLGELYKLPCFIWSLQPITYGCCMSTPSYFINSYGNIESNELCVWMWNCFIYLIKKLAVIFSIVSFYIFLLFYFIFWLIGKGIFILIMKIKGQNLPTTSNISSRRSSIQNNPGIPPVVHPIGNNGQSSKEKFGNQININNQINNMNMNYNNNNFNINPKEKPMEYNNGFNNNMNYNNNFVNNYDNFDKQTNPLPEKEQVEQQMYRPEPNAVYPNPNFANMGQNK